MRPPKHKPQSTSLIIARPSGTEVALPEELVGKARHYAAKSRSERTLHEYAKFWKKFERWCVSCGRDALPASIETVAGYMTWLAGGQDKGRPLAGGSISVAVAAIKFRHRSKGFAIDTDHPTVQNIWGGIRRELAKTRTIRRVKPLMNVDLRELLEILRPEIPREARDAAILALGWAAALRRSELVGLDWARLGTSEDKLRKGFLTADDKGLSVTLMTSKASQDTAQTVIVPADFAPLICRAVEEWIKVGQVQTGEAVLRGVKGRGWSSNPQSGYPGVCWSGKQGKWRVQAWDKHKKRRKDLGFFHAGVQGALDSYLSQCKEPGTVPSLQPHEGSIRPTRMDTIVVARTVKARIKQLAHHRNKQKGRKKLGPEEVAQLVAQFSGHSMRAGYATSAAQEDVPTHRIKAQTRHKSDGMLSIYIREVDKHKNSGLKGVGF